MKEEMLEYLKTQNVSVLAVEMLDGSPHAAALHFAHTEEPFAFIFKTSSDYRKSEAILKNGKTRASVVVGLTEGDDARTLQLDGEVRLLKNDEQLLQDTYYSKFPEKRKKYSGPTDIFLYFTSSWWRYTDWGKPEGKTILTDDGNMVVVNKK